jgi:hypothetical protein
MSWKCSEGCDQRAYLRETSAPCPHLSKLLGPKIGSFGQRIVFRKNLEAVYYPPDPSISYHVPCPTPEEALLASEEGGGEWGDDENEEDVLRQKLLRYGVSEKQVGILFSRVLEGKRFSKIAIEVKYVSPQSAARVFYYAVHKLKKRGFPDAA